MAQLLTLLKDGLFITFLDVDNALYTTSAIEHLPPREQQKAIFLATLLEFLARLSLITIFLFAVSGTATLFTVFGIEFTVDTISLFGAGAFLLLKSSKELHEFFQNRGETEQLYQLKEMPFSRLLLEMSIVNTVLSIDTVIAVTAARKSLSWMLFVLLMSAIIRLLFIREIARFIQRYPALNIIILTLLILIGIELISQGLGIDYELPFNIILLLSILGAIVYHWRRHRSIDAVKSGQVK